MLDAAAVLAHQALAAGQAEATFRHSLFGGQDARRDRAGATMTAFT